MMIKKRYSYPLSLLACSIITSMSYAEMSTIDQQREHAVVQIRQGDQAGLLVLKQLQEQNPTNQKILADYLESLKKVGQFDQRVLPLLANIDVNTFPDYAVPFVLKGLRDLQDFPQAINLAEKLNQVKPSLNLQILLGVLYAENKQPQASARYLDNLSANQLTSVQLSQVVYAYRIQGDYTKALSFATLAYQQAPNDKSVQEQYFQLLIALDSVDDAIKQADQVHLKQNNPILYAQVKQGYFSFQIRSAVEALNYKMDQAQPNPYKKLDVVLADMKAYAQTIDMTKPEYRQFNCDYIYALSVRNSDIDVIQLVNKLGYTTKSDLPEYTRQAIADAYLGARKPKIAEVWYKTLIGPKITNFNVYSGLYYSYIEQEKFNQASQLLKHLDQTLPKFQATDVVGARPTAHPDRMAYTNLYGLHLAYINHLNEAETYFKHLLEQAPNNASYITELAMIQRWNNKPLQAQQTLARLDGIDPVSKGVLLGKMQNAQSLGDVPTWRQTLATLEQLDPDDTGVIKAQKELNDRDHFSINHQTTWGQSKSEDSTTVRGLDGLNNRESITQVYSPYFANNYRMFAQYANKWSEFNWGEVHENRYGLGLEWAANQKSLSTLVSQDEVRNRAGINMQWSQWLNDHWNYQLGFDTAADIPLQVLDQNINGQSYNAGLVWQKDSTRRVNMGYQLTNIDDGNHRQELFTSVMQNLQNSAHHKTDAVVYAYYGKNSLANADYFNPSSNYSMDINFIHNWMTWRSYNQSFNQHFEADIGFYAEDGFSTLPTYTLQYKHEWQLSRTWSLNYGIGWSKHPYDGKQEEHRFATVGFTGIF